MATWAIVLFYIIFTSQILLLSLYFPNKILGRMKYILETYPPADYPKLYPKSPETYRIGHGAFKVINRLILLLGFVVLVAVSLLDPLDDGSISEGWPAVYGMLQFVPFAWLEFSEFGQFKSMRQANSATTRKAELRPRRLFDYVSPMMVAVAAGLFLAMVLADLYVHQFAMEWESFERGLWMLLANFVMGACGAWSLYGAKPDPHQAFDDRARQITTGLRSLFYVSMVISVFFILQTFDDVYNLDYLDAILMSLYFQIIVLLSTGHVLRSLKLEDINFDVYKSDTAVTS